jgi:hypothetical protein
MFCVGCAQTAESETGPGGDAQGGSAGSGGGLGGMAATGGAGGTGGQGGDQMLCPDGWGDCDIEPLNGCEINLKTNASNCGACGAKCPFGTGSYAACVAGNCELICTAGYQDCDDDPATGCEAQVSSDPMNCGACGVMCHGSCTDSACDPDDLATGRKHPASLEISATHAYWVEMGSYPSYSDGGVYVVPLAGGTPTTLAVTTAAAFGLAVDATHAYFTQRGNGNLTNGTISRVPLAGGLTETLATAQLAPANIVVDASHVYWVNAGTSPSYIDGSVNRLPLAGGTVEVLATGMYKPFFLAVNDSDVYWTNSGQNINMFKDGSLYMVPKAGGMATKLFDGGLMYGVVVDATHVYYNETGMGTVHKLPLGGGTAETLTTGQQNNIFLTQNADEVHWANFGVPDMGTGSIRYVSKLGGKVETPAFDQQTPYDLEVDASHVYWVNHGLADMNDGGVYRMPL